MKPITRERQVHCTAVRSCMLLFILATTITLAGCENPSAPEPSFGAIKGPQGSRLTFEYPQAGKETVDVTTVFGWNKGSFLEGNYWRTMRIGYPEGELTFRLNFPKDVRPESSVVEKEHNLRTGRLLLRNSQMLEEVSAELFIVNSKEVDDQRNAEGTVRIYLNYNNDEQVYGVVGEIDASIINRDGVPVKITGYFWKQNAE